MTGSQTPPPQILVCPNCGYPLTDWPQFCPTCGYRLKAKKPTTMIAAIIIVCLCGLPIMAMGACLTAMGSGNPAAHAEVFAIGGVGIFLVLLAYAIHQIVKYVREK